jgi:SAM-dependent methyltransferase
MYKYIHHQDEFLSDDAAFNDLYPSSIQMQAQRHWTPLKVARLATGFLTDGPPSRILDIGSGAGKFCLSAACFAPAHYFYGVEQRARIYEQAKIVQEKIGVPNVTFLNANFTQLNLRNYDHFYFFNSFYENLNEEGQIDDDIEYSEALYRYYVRYLYSGLQSMPLGTRIVTYHSLYEEIPLSYRLVDTLEEGNLNFWIKGNH